MKIVIAMDSLKGSLSSMESGNIIKDAIQEVMKAEVQVFPLADGGEGTVEALTAGLDGEIVKVTVQGPLGNQVEACYGVVSKTKTAIMEIAQAAGITLVPDAMRDPMNTTTYGVGEMIIDAMERGCRQFIIGIGGSATNDGGIGMLEALGAIFYDENKEQIGRFGRDMLKAASFDCSSMHPILKECRFQVACDVKNPLCGDMGASAVFGPQKGASPDIVQQMDGGLVRLADITSQMFGYHSGDAEGAGAAGGLGFAFLSFLKGELVPGISLILDAIHLEEAVKKADIVITGEGKLDFQTAMGKAPIGVAQLAKKYGAKVLAFSGGASDEAVECNKSGIDAYFPIIQLPMTVKDAMEYKRAKTNLKNTVTQVFYLIQAVYEMKKELEMNSQ